MAELKKAKTPIGVIDVLTPIKAIRAKCLDCCCGSNNEVRLCTCYKCSLWPYRSGKRPESEGKVKAKGTGNMDALKKAWQMREEKKNKEK